jgi:hypothetical protein
MRGWEARTLETPLRCRRTSLALAPFALALSFTAGVAHAQVSAGGQKVSGAARLEATLAPDPEGDPALSGSADLVVTPRRGRICFEIDLDESVKGADTVVAVHIHPGDVAESCDAQDCAPPIDLEFADEGLRGCARAGRQLLSSLVDEPGQFYLHVHTARFPKGAVRGQLEKR